METRPSSISMPPHPTPPHPTIPHPTHPSAARARAGQATARWSLGLGGTNGRWGWGGQMVAGAGGTNPGHRGVGKATTGAAVTAGTGDVVVAASTSSTSAYVRVR